MADERTPRTEAGKRLFDLLATEPSIIDIEGVAQSIRAIEREAALRAGAAHDEGRDTVLDEVMAAVGELGGYQDQSRDMWLRRSDLLNALFGLRRLAPSPEPVPSEDPSRG